MRSLWKPTRDKFLAGAVALSLSFAGCGGSSGPTLVPVDGTLTVDGKPVAGARIFFRPESITGTKTYEESAGVTDADGHFTLEGVHGGKGAMPGKHRVTINKLVMDDGSDLPPGTTDIAILGPKVRELLPPQYSSVEETTLTETVPPGGGDVELEVQSQPAAAAAQ
jgi:hypothetical protein